jgi:serine/threonine-protein kinase
MTDAERTQFIARTPPPPVALRRTDYTEPEDDDSRRTGLIWAAVVVALLLVIGAAGWAIVNFGKDSGPGTVAVPSIVGMTSDAASQAIRQANLKPEKGDNTSGACDDGQPGKVGKVCTVEPKVNTEVQEHTTVTYHLYVQGKVDVPPVEGKSLSDAENILHDHKLSWDVHYVNSTQPRNTVIHQDPPAFVAGGVAPGTKVKLSVSTGKVKLPNVVGLTFDAAQAKLNPNFTNINQVSQDTQDPNQDNIVATESPKPGFAYDPSTQINLVVYHYVAPPPTTPPTSPSTSTSASPGPSPTP